MRLRPTSELADALGVRDPRAVRARLAALGCPAVKLAGRWVVDLDAFERVRLPAGLTQPVPATRRGRVLPEGTRLWD